MTGISALWLPILLSAVLVFVASSIVHMVLPWHRGDYPPVPNEDAVRDALRPLAIPPGDYFVPSAGSPEAMRTPEFVDRMTQGPVLMMTVRPNGRPAMGKSLALWFFYCLVVGIFAAYVGSRALPAGAPYLRVFQIVSVTAFLAYAGALWQASIWFGRAWTTTLKSTVDGLAYALLTAGAFAWLWPR
jgi:hypothetical protein